MELVFGASISSRPVFLSSFPGSILGMRSRRICLRSGAESLPHQQCPGDYSSGCDGLSRQSPDVWFPDRAWETRHRVLLVHERGF